MKQKIKKNWYGRSKSGEELYDDSKSWISEINFIQDEMRFCNKMLSSNYANLLDTGLNKEIKFFTKQIVSQKKIGSTLNQLIKDHKKNLFKLIENKTDKSNVHFFEVHKKLEKEIESHLRTYKDLKKQIYQTLDKLMTKKAQKKLG